MLIGFCSTSPQVGKSTASSYLSKHYEFLYGELNEPIIAIAKWFFGYNSNKSNSIQRKLLQDIGLAGKQFSADIWLYQALNLAKRRLIGMQIDIKPSLLYYYNADEAKEQIAKMGIEQYFNGQNVVLSGIRSPGEADEFKKIGGKIILIKRGDDFAPDSTTHKVEYELFHYNNFDHIIDNNGSMENLHNELDKLVDLCKRNS